MKLRSSTCILLGLLLLICLSTTTALADALREATQFSRAGEWSKAIAAFQTHLAEHPKDGRSQANLGVAFSRLDRHKEALLAYDKALELKYDNALFRYYRGLSFAKVNLMDEAVTEIQKALKKDPRMTLADYDLGLIYLKMGKYDEARSQVKKLYKRNYKLSKKLHDQVPTGYQIKSVDNGGTLTGKVRLEGKIPKARSFHLIHAPNIQYCSRISDGKGHRIVYDFSVSPESRGMQDTVIAILGVHKGKPFSQQMMNMKINRCAIDRYVIGIRNGENILLENTDPIKHEIATYEIFGAHRNQTSNKNLLPRTSQVRSTFIKPGAPEFILKCNLHPFLQTRGVIVDNPYYTVTDAEGKFEIKDVPPGTYDVMAWHPFIPVLKGTITIGAGREAKLDFTFDSKNVRRKLYQDDTEGYRFNTWYDSFEDFYGGPRVDDPVEVLQEFDNTKRYKGYLEPF